MEQDMEPCVGWGAAAAACFVLSVALVGAPALAFGAIAAFFFVLFSSLI